MNIKSFTKLVLIILCAGNFCVAVSQTDNDHIRSWNDIQVSWEINKRIRALFGGTLRIGNNLSKVQETRFTPGFSVRVFKNFSVSTVVSFISAANASGRFRREYRPTIKLDYKKPLKHFTLGHRSTFEWRYRPGRDSWRYRPSFIFEKALPKSFLSGAKLFVVEDRFTILYRTDFRGTDSPSGSKKN